MYKVFISRLNRFLLLSVLFSLSFAGSAQEFLPKLDPLKSLQKDTGNYYFKEIWINSRDVSNKDAAGYIRRATDKMDLNYFREALADINKSITIDSLNSYSHFLRGVIHLRFDSAASALIDFKKSIALNDSQKYSIVYSAQIYGVMGKYYDADSLYKRAISIDKKFHEAYFGLGNLYFMKGDLSQAEKQYKKAVDVKPDFAQAYMNLAIVYLMRDPFQATKYLNKCIKADPSFSYAYFLRGYIGQSTGKISSALQDWNKAIEIDSLNNLYRISIAFLYINEKKYKEGTDILIKMIRSTKTKNYIGDFERSPKEQLASDFLSQLLTYTKYDSGLSSGEKADILSGLCSFYLEKHKTAEDIYQTILMNSSSAPGLIHYLRGFNQEYLYEQANAVKSYMSAANCKNFPDEAFMRKGIALFDQTKYNESIESLSKFISKNDSTKLAFRARANAFVRIEQYDSAIIDYTSYINIDSTQPDIYKARALCYKTIQNYPKAISDYSLIMRHNYYDVESAGLLAVCRYLNGDTVGAYIQLNRTLIDMQYLSETGYYLLGTINLLKKQYESAVEDFKMVLMINPGNIDALVYRALAYYSLEDYLNSKINLEAAIQLNENEITALYTLGLVDIKLNSIDEAYEKLQKADMLGHPLARAAIERYLKNYKPAIKN
jgi:tetratricopeptide (TPR) repeat protein